MSAVDLRYARALSEVVSNQNLEEHAVQLQLNNFSEALDASLELRKVLEDPSIPELQKLKVLDKLAEPIGMTTVVRNFIVVVVHHHRLHQLSSFIAAYATLVDEEANVAKADIVSAHLMEQADREMLETRISQITGSKRVQATYAEDASLIGGAVVTVGSTVYDGSIRAQLQQLKARLIEAGS